MPFELRTYDVFLYPGTVATGSKTGWRRLADCLDPIFGAPAKAAIQTSQKLGRLTWQDWPKWTGAKFEYAFVTSPSWAQSVRLNRSPDAIFQTQKQSARVRRAGVESLSLFACAIDSPVHAAAQVAAKRLQTSLNASALTARKRWGRRLGRDGHEAYLQYFLFSIEPDERTGALRLPKWRALD